MESDKKIIAGCLKSDRKAQKRLYDKYAPEMINICLRYCNCKSTAKDVLQEGFLSVFKNIGQLKDPKKLKAWIKQIIVNTALIKLRKRESLVFLNDEVLDRMQKVEVFTDESYQFKESDLKQILDSMPKGYKVIFDLYVKDDFTHKEIADMLNISENTSKSQLSRARNYLREKLYNLKNEYYSKLNTYLLIGSILWILYQIS